MTELIGGRASIGSSESIAHLLYHIELYLILTKHLVRENFLSHFKGGFINSLQTFNEKHYHSLTSALMVKGTSSLIDQKKFFVKNYQVTCQYS